MRWLRGGRVEGRLLIRLIWDDGRVSNRACGRLDGGNSVWELASDEWYGERCCWQQSIISSEVVSEAGEGRLREGLDCQPSSLPSPSANAYLLTFSPSMLRCLLVPLNAYRRLSVRRVAHEHTHEVDLTDVRKGVVRVSHGRDIVWSAWRA